MRHCRNGKLQMPPRISTDEAALIASVSDQSPNCWWDVSEHVTVQHDAKCRIQVLNALAYHSCDSTSTSMNSATIQAAYFTSPVGMSAITAMPSTYSGAMLLMMEGRPSPSCIASQFQLQRLRTSQMYLDEGAAFAAMCD